MSNEFARFPEYHWLAGLAPDEIRELSQRDTSLQQLPEARDGLIHLTSAETAERQKRAEAFLKMPAVEFPAE